MTLLLAWGAMDLANRSATARHTFGFKKGTILASFVSALLLCVAIGVIIWEALGRLRSPVPVHGMTITIVAAIGVVINTATALLFMAGRKNDLNIKGAFLHMAAYVLSHHLTKESEQDILFSQFAKWLIEVKNGLLCKHHKGIGGWEQDADRGRFAST